MIKTKTIKENIYFVALLLGVIMYGFLWFSKYGGENICSDGKWYYEYFVRIFIDHNLQGGGLIKYPVGTMVLELPFLMISWLICTLSGIDYEGGYNLHFQRSVFIAALFYLSLTLILLYRFLKKKFSKKAAVICLLVLVFGTMIPVYICELSSFSHIYGLFICTCFFIFIDYYENRYTTLTNKNKFILNFFLGILLGYATIIRNTDIVIGAAYLFYGVNSFKDFIGRIKEVFTFKIFIQILGYICIYSIQIIFWRIMSGEWIFYSYGEETFLYKFNPQVLDVLFSDGKGLLIYCPVLFIALLSMAIFRKENINYWISSWVIFAAVTYFIAAWWCWWLGAAYSERMYCDILVIFAIPLASFYQNLICYRESLNGDIGWRQCIPIVCYGATLLFVLLNLTWISATRSGVLSNNFGTWFDLKNSFFEFFIK